MTQARSAGRERILSHIRAMRRAVTGSPRRHPPGAAVTNSFGFAGQNVCLVLTG